MGHITTYSARKTNPFVWLAVLLSLCSVVTRIIFHSSSQAVSFAVWIVLIFLPIVAGLTVSIRLPYRGEEMFYVTIGPVVMYGIYFIVFACLYGFGTLMTIGCAAFTLLLCAMYFITYAGKISSGIPVLACFLVAPAALVLLDDNLIPYVNAAFAYGRATRNLLISDGAIILSIICMILSARKLPEPEEGEERRRRFGDRYDGYKIHDIDPMASLVPDFMPSRIGSMNFISDSIDVAAAERYIREMRKAGYKHFGMTHLFIAAYTRAIAELPDVNRFIAGQKIYAAKDIWFSMAVKKEMDLEGIETTIKVKVDRTDTAGQIYDKFDQVVQGVKNSDESEFDICTKILNCTPGLLKAFLIWFISVLDYFNLLPAVLIEKFSPFHGSMFITSMGSLGIPPIYHHLYNWGTVPCFCAFGNKYTKYELAEDGTVHSKRYIDFKWTIDERTVDGFYYSRVLKAVRRYLTHPEKLNEPPEKLVPYRI